MQEFSISDSISSNRTKPQPAASHDPFSQPAAPERNAEDPLAMFNDSDPTLERKNVDPDTLFSDEALFKKRAFLTTLRLQRWCRRLRPSQPRRRGDG
jgi:FHA domain-containing protein